MKRIKTVETVMGKLFTGISLFLFLGLGAFPRWYVNGSSNAFYDSAHGSTAVSLESYVIQGAAHFLDSYTAVVSLLKHLEWAGKDGGVSPAAPMEITVTDRSLLLDKALQSMECAHAAFIQLKQRADITPYNPAATEKLRQFDYNAFKAAYHIDDGVFPKVRDRLARADIRALYGDIVSDTMTIIKQLKQLKDQVNAGIFPAALDVWKLDRAYSDSLRFGQYSARIFEAAGITN